jgi:hypothetical protein
VRRIVPPLLSSGGETTINGSPPLARDLGVVPSKQNFGENFLVNVYCNFIVNLECSSLSHRYDGRDYVRDFFPRRKPLLYEANCILAKY